MGGILTSCYTYKDVYEIIFHVIDKSFMLINLESFLHVCVALLMPTKGLIVAASKHVGGEVEFVLMLQRLASTGFL